MSILHLSALPEQERRRRCAAVVPGKVFESVAGIGHGALSGGPDNPLALRVDAVADVPRLHIGVPAMRIAGDFAFSLELAEAGAGQLELAFIIINDLRAPRFNIDTDARGKPTLLGTATRNLREEERALRAGLGPSQVRLGLRALSEMLPRLEHFAQTLGYVAIQLEALTYHVAVMYEQAGFAYVSGRRRMAAINAAFAPGGKLFDALDGSSPFRQRTLWTTPRGRAWAVHDGILTHLDGEPNLKVEMVKVIGQDARQRTFDLTAKAE